MVNVTGTMEVAVQHHKAGRLQQAEKLYNLVLQSVPDHPVVLHSLGTIAYQKGQHNIAVELISKAIASNRQVPQFYNSIGVVFVALGKLEKAVGAYKQAISLKPDYTEAYNNLALALSIQGRFTEAIANLKQAIQLSPESVEPYYNLANLLQQQDKYPEAIENYKQAIQLKPDFAEAYSNLGNALKDHGQCAEAVKSYRQAIRLKPDCAEIYYNMGNALKNQAQHEEAIESYNQAIRLDPEYAEAYCNLGVAQRELGQYDKAIKNYEHAIQLKPKFVEAHWNRSLILLLRGQFAEGWKEYEWRRNTDLRVTAYPNRDKIPRWDGSSFAGKRLFVHYEQGLGDNIQFLRYLPMVKSRGGSVIYEAKKPLLGLLGDFEGIDELKEATFDGKPAVKFDYHIPLLSLPRIFGTTLKTIPADVPYLTANPAKVKHWRQRLVQTDFKVGLVWAGKPSHGNDYNRSCALDHFAPLAGIDGVKLYGLQKGQAAEQAEKLGQRIPVINFGNEFKDFTDTAGMIENLDLVISVDTSVAHLAGAMAKAVWVVLPFVPEWRWMLEREDSPWYPTMRLFRQEKPGDWDGVFQCIAKQLQILMKKQLVVS